MRDSYNIIPVTMALFLHVLVFGAMLVAFDWSRNVQPITPMAITATLVTESAVVVPPPPVERQPEPEPVVVEPEPDLPDPAEQERIRLEEEARILEARREQERIARERELERQRQAELEAQRLAEEEARLERERAEAERRRQEDIERQRQENLRLMQEEEERLLAEARQAELAAEAERLEAMNSTEMQLYQTAIRQKIQRNWTQPATAREDLLCLVAVRQLPNGEVVSVRILNECNGDDVVKRSIVAAVRNASPLPLPNNPLLFLDEFTFRFTIPD